MHMCTCVCVHQGIRERLQMQYLLDMKSLLIPEAMRKKSMRTYTCLLIYLSEASFSDYWSKNATFMSVNCFFRFDCVCLCVHSLFLVTLFIRYAYMQNMLGVEEYSGKMKPSKLCRVVCDIGLLRVGPKVVFLKGAHGGSES